MQPRSLAHVSVAATLLVAPCLASNLWTVGVDVPTIDAGIAAAVDGDVIVVPTGTYPGFTVNGKGLTFQADGPVTLTGSVRVLSIAAPSSVVLRGFKIEPPTSTPVGCEVANCTGTVWIEACSCVFGAYSNLWPASLRAFEVTSSSSVVVIASQFQGGTSSASLQPSQPIAAPALVATSSALHVYASTFVGGKGGCSSANPTNLFCIAGAPAVLMNGGSLLLSDSTAKGGNSESYSNFGCQAPSPGAGVQYVNGLVRAQSTQPIGGLGTSPGFGTCPPAPQAPGYNGNPANLLLLPGGPVRLSVASPQHESTTVKLAVEAPVGSFALIGIGLAPLTLFDASFSGSFLVAPPHLLFPLGSVPAPGQLALGVPLDDLGLGVEVLVGYAQSAALLFDGTAVLGRASVVTVLE